MKPPVKIGGDPEFFIANGKEMVASCDLIGGTKGAGIPFDESLGKSAKWLEDNVAVELNFDPQDDWSSATQMIIEVAKGMGRALKAKSLYPVIKPVIPFRPHVLTNPKALVFGCDPDFCAYDKDPKKARTLETETFKDLRFAGGHLHLSYDNRDEVPHYAVAMILDAIVGLSLVKWDKQGERRSRYGLAGLFRPKSYGIEYRTPSNFWLAKAYECAQSSGDTHVKSSNWISGLFMATLSVGQAVQDRPLELSGFYSRLPFSDIRKAINNEDAPRAAELLNFIRNLSEYKSSGLSTSVGHGAVN